jgi:hypothetical protein
MQERPPSATPEEGYRVPGSLTSFSGPGRFDSSRGALMALDALAEAVGTRRREPIVKDLFYCPLCGEMLRFLDDGHFVTCLAAKAWQVEFTPRPP